MVVSASLGLVMTVAGAPALAPPAAAARTTSRPVQSHAAQSRPSMPLLHGNRVHHPAPGSLHAKGETLRPVKRTVPAGRRAPFTLTAGTSGWDAADLQSAYALPSTTGGVGKTVAVVDAFDAPNLESDLATYRAANNLSPCTTANGCLRKLAQDGSSNYPPASRIDWAAETTLDAEMISAACPNCHILVVEANSDLTTDLLSGVDEATSLHPNAVSMSWGGPEYSQETSDDAHFVGKGDITFFASAGDDGTSNASWPAASPDVLSVGGTDLYQSGSTGRAWYETAWAGSTHGCSAYEAVPPGQTANTGCGGMRADNDISADAGTAMALYYTPPGSAGSGSGAAIQPAGGGWGTGWQGAGGTSASSPFLAALYLLTGDPRAFTDPLSLYYQLAYQYGADAVNEVAGLLAYALATGLGSPNGELPGIGYRGPGETDGNNPGESDGAPCMKGDPVECSTGNLSEAATDLGLPGRGRSLRLRRTYSSLAAAAATAAGPFGYGWSFSYGSSLSVDTTSGTVTVGQGEGTTISFIPDGNGGYGEAGWVTARLARNGDGTWTLTYPDQTTDVYDSAGRLVTQADRTGETTTLGYDGTGRLATVTDPAGRELTFSYDTAGQVSSVSDPTGRTVRYGYDASGDLTSVTDPMGAVTSYGYDSRHRLASLTDSNGGTTTNAYDSSDRVISQVDPMHRTSTWSYDDSTRTTSYTDPGGAVEVLRYNAYGQLVTVTKAAGTAQASTWSYAYAPGTGELESTIDPAGRTTLYAWDGNGNLTGKTDALGRTWSSTYDSANDRTSATDPSGTTTTTTYTSRHEPATVTFPLTASSNATTSFTYSSAHPGDLLTVTDANGHITHYAHDPYGDVTSATDADGNVRTASFDSRGELTSATTARGFITSYTYDADGRRTSVTDPYGHTTTFNHDNDGNLTAVTDANGRTTTSYDADNEATSVIKPDGATTSYGYDADGRRIRVTDGNGNVWTYRYDALGQVTAATDPLSHTTSYGYDPVGNLVARTTATGVTATMSYDAANELVGTSYSDGTTPGVAYGYDADGRRSEMADGSGTTTYAYDLAGRLTASSDGNGDSVSYAYDAVGNVTTLGYPTGITVTRTFDSANRLTAVNDGVGNVTNFGYDADGNLTTEAFPNGVTATYGYDKNDQALSVRDATSTATLATFSYSHTAVGQVASMASDLAGQAGVTDNYTYTQDGQVATDSTTAVSTTTFGYDRAGNLITADGATLGYDSASEVTTRAATAIGGAASTTYGYNANGDRTTISTAGQTVSLGYDGADRLTGYGSAARYTYNGDGLRVGKTIGVVFEALSWDTVTASAPLLLTDATNAYVYGPGGRVIEQLSLGLVATYLHQDALGSTRLLTSANGTVVGGFKYNAYGAPAGAVTTTGNTVTTPIGFAGGYTDSESGFVYLVNRYYDPATGQFITRDPLQPLTGTPYAYALGDPLDITDALGLCSWSICTAFNSAVNAVSNAGSQLLNAGSQLLDAAGNAISAGVDFVYNDAAGISAVTGTLAVLTAPIPLVSLPLGAISVTTGAIATLKDLAAGEGWQALLDAAGTAVGGAGFAEDLIAQLLSRGAGAAWDTADLYLAHELADMAEPYEATGKALDIWAAVLAWLGYDTDKFHLFGC
jgi:RHS repeat-associated protein